MNRSTSHPPHFEQTYPVHAARAALLHSAAELINRAADLCSDSAGLVNDNERRWRIFRERVVQITGTTT